jgi:hypothetical protein
MCLVLSNNNIFGSLNLVLFTLIFTECTKTRHCSSEIRMRESASFSFTAATGFFFSTARNYKPKYWGLVGSFDTVFLFLIRHLVLPNVGWKLKDGVPSGSLLPVPLGHVANVNIPSTIVEWFLSSETLGLA